MNILLGLLLFLGATYLGHLIYNDRKMCVKYRTTGNIFIITYGKRVINIELREEIRIPSYSRSKDVECIVVPKRTGNLKQIENFMTRYKTSILAEAMFRFSESAHALPILRYDPVQAKKLIDVQIKLKCFITNI